MPTQHQIAVDWRRKGFFCWEAVPADSLNILPSPVTYVQLDVSSNHVTSVERKTLRNRYGRVLFRVQSGTGAYFGLRLGYSDTSGFGSLSVDTAGTYYVSVRVRGVNNYSGVPILLAIKDSTGNIGTGTLSALTDDWQTVSASFPVSGATDISIEVLKQNDTTDVEFDVAGIMLVKDSLPSGYNAGHELDRYDNITSRVLNADWSIGANKAYQEMPHASTLKLALDNHDKRFSPEYTSSPLYDVLMPQRSIRVQADDGSTVHTLWTGWIETFMPTPNRFGERRTMVKAVGAERLFSNVDTDIELQENKRTDELAARLLDEVPIPPPLVETTVFLDSFTLDQSVLVGTTIEQADGSNWQEGKTTLAYAADNWVSRDRSSDGARDQFNVYRAIKDVAAAERGRFFFNREGQAAFFNRHKFILDQAIDATFSNDMTELDYQFASLDDFANEVKVTCHPRDISEGDVILWQLVISDPVNDPIRLGRNDEREINISYTDDSDNRIGGKDVYIANLTFELSDDPTLFGVASVRLDAKANGATLKLQSGSQTVKITSLEIRGKKITDFGQMEAKARDAESITSYGLRTMTLNLPSVDDFGMAQDIADFEVLRRNTPSGKVKSLTVRSHAVNGGQHHNHQLALTVGDVIQLSEAQTEHSQVYFIIGEGHKLTDAGTLLETTWYLEAVPQANWAILSTSNPIILDASTPFVLAY